ncbi:voltage-dependent calcium channel gamma-6 subunit isoform X2 [Conger conger]|nr:voltage-dependent calcium channel gamma-6 subunit isoform X2 [Conger conger]XP_061091203.1 voltage-dependent calcium channel gamma-6 subunit isoform X2 [Conger conger]XP_061091212.1 voltage-dependent calcium channel gamma-6 subunit isoform X2 [Conger conger]
MGPSDARTTTMAMLKGARGAKRRAQATSKMSDSQEGKIKLAFFVAIVGVTLTVLGVGTEFWVELAPPKSFYNNQTCLTAHYGLWKSCMRTLWVSDIDPERESCGPAELPGESNCTYFKFFTSGENAVIFKKTTTKNLNITAAVFALLSLFMMVTGSICISMSLSKGVPFFLKPASFCFIVSGILVFLTLIIFHQSVLSLVASDHSVPLHHDLSWSAACVGSAGAIVILAGIIFVILSLPHSPWEKCLPHNRSDT